tara:strand:+ start:151 stop:552 length:402 start_codon:yes stop_codon:yes gene_type:complete
MTIYNIKNISVADEEEKYKGNFEGDVHFIMGPLSIYQFNQFANHGLCAVRLFQYIRTKQGLVYGSKPEFKGKDTSHKWIYIDNKNLYDWFGLHQPTKWKLLKQLSETGLIEYQKRGSGRMPLVRIKAPKKNLN